MSYKEEINHLKDDFSKNSHKLRIADVEDRHTDCCTKCTVKPIIKEHLCEECYITHNAWLKLEHKAHDLDGDNWHTLYDSWAVE